VQDDTHADVLTLTLPQHVGSSLELQLFHELSAAEQWLHTCQ
jgi:hypothetical protein